MNLSKIKENANLRLGLLDTKSTKAAIAAGIGRRKPSEMVEEDDDNDSPQESKTFPSGRKRPMRLGLSRNRVNPQKTKALRALKKYGLDEDDWHAIYLVGARMAHKVHAYHVAEWITGVPLTDDLSDYKPGRAAKLCEDSFKIKLAKSEADYVSPSGEKKRKGFIAKECFIDSNGKPCKPTIFHKLLFLGFSPESTDFYRKNGIKNAGEIIEKLEGFGVYFPDDFYDICYKY